MTYVDLAVGLGFFLFFIALVMGLSVERLVKTPTEATIEEYRESAMAMFQSFFSTAGTPGDWEDSSDAPSELGLVKTVYKIPITVEELGIAARTDEPVVVKLFFDDECSSSAWNDTVRAYDSSLAEHQYELVNPAVCSSQFLNESYIRFKVNISQGEEKTFYVFYSEDTGIPGPDHTMSYSTSSWIPSSGDSWSESTASWSQYVGGVAALQTSTTKMRGDASIEIDGAFSNDKLGLKYEPSSTSGVVNGWYIDSWIYVDDLSGVSSVDVSVSEVDDMITTSISSSSMESATWYHFEKNLTSSEWGDWTVFDASNGIDNITFHMVNTSADISRVLKVDEMHFGKRPLEVKSFPAEEETVIYSKKMSALNNLSYDQLRDVAGEEYQFRIEIIEG